MKIYLIFYSYLIWKCVILFWVILIIKNKAIETSQSADYIVKVQGERMMKEMMKKLSLCLAALLGGSMLFGNLGMVSARAEHQQVYEGSNVEHQDYFRCSYPICSYLSYREDGGFMRVQAADEIEGVLIEYYDSEYHFQSSCIIPEELPEFGGFYETADNYYLVTGQWNFDESAEVEVIRITKYDAFTMLGDGDVTVTFRSKYNPDLVKSYKFIIGDFVTPEPSPEPIISPTEPPAMNVGWKLEDGEYYWYEDGVKQGTEGRGKEIYDPGSDAWYWLDAVQGGRVAKGKDVYQESDGGKWGRYDAAGCMVKGWDENENGRYYFDVIYGTMAKGRVNINGSEYYFDEATGVCQN